MMTEKHILYTTQNSYTTVNNFTSKTKNVWLVFHGMGYLSKYFARYFKELSPEENFVIVPQAPSKYYQDKSFKHVGASWLTRENTQIETQNVLKYVDAVWEAERPENAPNFIVLGYSQGVSIATRWLSSRQISCNHLILHSGGVPTELEPKDFNYLPHTTKVTYVYGNQDQYITEARVTEESLKSSRLFGNRLTVSVFNGIHEVNTEIIQKIASLPKDN